MLTGLFFALFYATGEIPMAGLADRYNRVRIVATLSWRYGVSSPLYAALATGFVSLALARIGVGAGEASSAAARLLHLLLRLLSSA